MKKTRELYSQKKYEEALSEIENGIKEFGKARNLLNAEFAILMELGRFDSALKTAIKKDQISGKKSP